MPKRKDLLPGTIFRYSSGFGELRWVPAGGFTCPESTYVSHPDPPLLDTDCMVVGYHGPQRYRRDMPEGYVFRYNTTDRDMAYYTGSKLPEYPPGIDRLWRSTAVPNTPEWDYPVTIIGAGWQPPPPPSWAIFELTWTALGAYLLEAKAAELGIQW